MTRSLSTKGALLLGLLLIQSCAQQEKYAPMSFAPLSQQESLEAQVHQKERPTVSHQIFTSTLLPKNARSQQTQEALDVQIDQFCGYIYEGKIESKSLKFFQLGKKAFLLAQCVSETSQVNMSQRGALSVYGKYKIPAGMREREQEAKAREKMKTRCTQMYQGQLSQATLLFWRGEVGVLYAMAQCQVGAKKKRQNSFD